MLDLKMDLLEQYPFNLTKDIFGDEKEALSITLEGVSEALNTLKDREKKIIECRYKDKLTLKATGESEGISPERVRQIQAKAISKLRHPNVANRIRAYSYNELLKYSKESMKLWEENKKLKEILKNLKELSLTESLELMGKLENLESVDEILKLSNKGNIPIEGLKLSTRSYNALKRNGVKTLSDLKAYSLYDLKKVRNLGERSIKEIVEALKDYDIVLLGS